MKNVDLIKKALSVIKPRKMRDGLLGDVGSALITDKNKIYLGVCAGVGSNTFCAEQNAIGSMITKKEFNIKKIVAVWIDENKKVHIVPPCGNCRQLMIEIELDNMKNTEVVLDLDKTVLLKKLLPHDGGWKKIEIKKK